MRTTQVLTPEVPNNSLSLTFEAVALQFSNPTLSRIVYRQGGTDFPTANSADFVIPPQSIMRVPAVGRQFAFGFLDTVELINGGIQIARITALDNQESQIQIGSVQPTPQPNFYEFSRGGETICAFFLQNGSWTAGSQTGISFTVPVGYIFLCQHVFIRMKRPLANGAPSANWFGFKAHPSLIVGGLFPTWIGGATFIDDGIAGTTSIINSFVNVPFFGGTFMDIDFTTLDGGPFTMSYSMIGTLFLA